MLFGKKSFFRRQQEARGEIPETYHYNLDEKFQKQFIIIWRQYNFRYANIVYNRLCFELGQLDLGFSLSMYKDKKDQQLIDFFIRNEKDEYSLAVIEFVAYFIYRADKGRHGDEKQFIDLVNELFLYNRIGYKLIIDSKNRDVNIIKIDDEIFYSECTEKSLGILSTKKYTDAQSCYIESYKKLAKSEYTDALVDIGRAIESVLKTRFAEYNIPFDAKKDTLNKLLDIAQAHVDTVAHDFQYFKQIILDVGRVRNPSGHGHAQGQAPQLDEVYVRFVINQAAANLLFLAEVPMRT
jgi:hypothetical protein